MQLIPREIYSSLVSQFTRASQTCISTSNHQDRTCLREIHGDKWCQARIALVPIKWARILAISVIPIRLFSIGLWLTFSFCHFLIGYKHCQPEKYRNRNSPLIFSKYSIPCEALIDTATMSSSHRPKQMYGHSPLVKKRVGIGISLFIQFFSVGLLSLCQKLMMPSPRVCVLKSFTHEFILRPMPT